MWLPLPLLLLPLGQEPPQDTLLKDTAAARGLVWSHSNGAVGEYLYPEGLGGGCALFDFDADGDLDVYLVQSGSFELPRAGNRLFENRGDEGFVDVTERAGVGDTGYGMGVACGDHDRDGDVDLYVVNLGANVLYENQGDGTFRDVTEASGAGDEGFGATAAFFDADLDGDLDLFLVNNLNWSRALERTCRNTRGVRDYCGPRSLDAASADVLLRNDGGKFVDVSRAAGLLATTGNGLGVCIADEDLDGDLDVYVANDGMPNALWRNQGEGVFVDVARRAGCSVNLSGAPEASMGVQWADIDGDLDLDLFMTHLRGESNTFYQQRSGRYRDRTGATGLVVPSLRPTGFGMGFHDLDLDGQLDLFVANGAIQSWDAGEAPAPDRPYAEHDQLFLGLGRGRFAEHALDQPARVSRAAAFGDLDNDGDIDVVVVDQNEPVRLLENQTNGRSGRSDRWLGLRVLDGKGAAAIGAQVRLETKGASGTRGQLRLVAPAHSYFASNDPRVHFGVDEGHVPVAVHVRWPGETSEVSVELEQVGCYAVLQRTKDGAEIFSEKR